MSNHLASIETRQRKTRVRDLFFALAIVAAGVVSVHTVSTAVTAASPTHVAQR